MKVSDGEQQTSIVSPERPSLGADPSVFTAAGLQLADCSTRDDRLPPQASILILLTSRNPAVKWWESSRNSIMAFSLLEFK